jgi:hypothetical protein
MYCKYSDGNTVTLVQARYARTLSSELISHHTPLTDQNEAILLGLGWQQWTVSGVIADSTTVRWRDIAQISLDNVLWRACKFPSVDFPSNMYQQTLYELRLLVSNQLEGATFRYPVSGYQWGQSALANVHHHGAAGIAAVCELNYLAPDFYFPLLSSLADFAGRGLTFTRVLAKAHGGISYLANVPIFDNGLNIDVDTSPDIVKWTPSTAAVRTIAFQIKLTGTALGAYTLWTATHNKLYTTGNYIYWTDDNIAIQANFPAAAYAAGTVIDIVVTEAASHACAVHVHAAGGSWSSGTATLPAIVYPELTLGPLNGSISNLVEYPYVLAQAEYEDIDYSSSPLKFNTMYIGNRNGVTIQHTTDHTLLLADLTDVSGLLGGTPLTATTANTTITCSAGLSARWYVQVKDTSIS